MSNAKNKRVAILVANGFEQSELTEPRKQLEEAGAQTKIVSPERGRVKGWQHARWGDEFEVDETLEEARVEEFDALVLPGGQMNPDFLRTNEGAVRFVRAFVDSGKPVAAICHGPWLLVEADVARGRQLTSYHSIQTDLRNAGADWVDREVVVDGNLITSRSPDDLDAFSKAVIGALGTVEISRPNA